MNPQERDVINGIFDRLKQAEAQPRDAEAETLIADRLAAQPGAAYLLAQIVHVQEQALTNLNDRVNSLEAEVTKAKAAPAGGGGFLANLFGASSSPQQPIQTPPRPAAQPRPDGQTANAGSWGQQGAHQQQGGPWGNRAGAGGGGFLASAMTTAAGVAGGMMLGNVLTNAFGMNSGAEKPAADQSADAASAAPAATQDTADTAQTDTGYQDASYDPGFDGGFDDFGGGDDWI